jgi:cytochrome c553
MPLEQTQGVNPTGVVTCKNCHQPHLNNIANLVADPDNGASLPDYTVTRSGDLATPGPGKYVEDDHAFYYNSGSNNDPTNPVGYGGPTLTEPDYIQFCLACHDGTTPPGVTITTTLDNIATSYATDKHGAGDAGTDITNGTLKAPWTSTPNTEPGTYAALNCTTCHGAHGSENLYNLRSKITMAGTVMTIGGENGAQTDSPYFGTDTYILPLMDGNKIGPDGVQKDLYWGAWCTFCHKMESHGQGQSEGSKCQSGHVHNGGGAKF